MRLCLNGRCLRRAGPRTNPGRGSVDWNLVPIVLAIVAGLFLMTLLV